MALALAADDTPAAKQYQALLSEYEQQGGPRAFAPRFLELAEEHADDAVAVDALLWIVKNVTGRRDTTRALELLATQHLKDEKLGPACVDIARSRSVTAEKLLRAIWEESPDQLARAQACFHLASLLDSEARIVDQLNARRDLAPRVLQYYGNEYGEHMMKLKPAELAEQREAVYERLLKSFPDVEIQDTTMGKIAEKALFAIRHLSVGKVAPEIEGEDIFGNEFKLSDYRGKIVMITFWGHW
jgi:hypothetical protein